MKRLKINGNQLKALMDFKQHAEKINSNPLNLFMIKKPFNNVFVQLNHFTFNEMALLLLEWYEVIPEFKLGDWVTDVDLRKTGQVLELENNCFKVDYNGSFANYGQQSTLIRKATEEEIKESKTERFWLKLNRHKNEYREGDIIRGKGWITNYWRIGQFKKYVDGDVLDGDAMQIEDISDGSTYDLRTHTVKLVCPFEQRLDLK